MDTAFFVVTAVGGHHSLSATVAPAPPGRMLPDILRGLQDREHAVALSGEVQALVCWLHAVHPPVWDFQECVLFCKAVSHSFYVNDTANITKFQ